MPPRTITRRKRPAEAERAAAKAADASGAPDEPRTASGFFRGVLFALPFALIFWTLVILAGRALSHHLLHH